MVFGALVQTNGNSTTGSTTVTATLNAVDITEGNLIVAVCSIDDSATFNSTPTGYDQAATISNAITTSGMYYKIAGASESSTLTFTFSPQAGQEMSCRVAEFEGPWEGQSSVLDQAGSAQHTTAVTGDATPDLATTQSSGLLISSWALQDAAGNSAGNMLDSSAGATWTLTGWNRAVAALGGTLTRVAHRVVTATGTYNSSWDWSGDNSRVISLAASFKKDEGGAPPPAAVKRHFTTLGVGR